MFWLDFETSKGIVIAGSKIFHGINSIFLLTIAIVL
jgi:hypothetical protein